MLVDIQRANAGFERRDRHAQAAGRAPWPGTTAPRLSQHRFDLRLDSGSSSERGWQAFRGKHTRIEPQDFIISKNHATLNDVLKLADVSRPRVCLHRLKRLILYLSN